LLFFFCFFFCIFINVVFIFFFFFSSRRRHTRWTGDWSSDVCSSDLAAAADTVPGMAAPSTRNCALLMVWPASGDGGLQIKALAGKEPGNDRRVRIVVAEQGARWRQARHLGRGVGELKARHGHGRKCERGDALASIGCGGLHRTDLSSVFGCYFIRVLVVVLAIAEAKGSRMTPGTIKVIAKGREARRRRFMGSAPTVWRLFR